MLKLLTKVCSELKSVDNELKFVTKTKTVRTVAYIKKSDIDKSQMSQDASCDIIDLTVEDIPLPPYPPPPALSVVLPPCLPPAFTIHLPQQPKKTLINTSRDVHKRYVHPAFIQSILKVKNDYLQDTRVRFYHRKRNASRQRHKTKMMAKCLDLHSLRKWENLTGNQEPDMHSGFIFTIMTYNVLAQGLIDQHLNLYREHNSTNLNWEVRWPKLLQEIGTLKPDILCLQEVQESHVQDHFNTLSALGYTGIYKKRTGGRIDGCAIYYKSNNLTLIEHTAVEYFQPSVKLLNRDNVALIAKFSPKFHLKEFIVATTHLLYNPKREDVRMAQVQLLLTEIERLSYKNDGRQASYLPVILTGDFNALPNSVLYQFLTRGTMIYNNLNSNLVDRRFPQPMLVTTNLGISDDCQHVELLDKRQNNANLSRSDESDLIKLTSGKRNSTMKMLNNSTFIPGKGVLTHKFNFKTAYDNQIGTTAQDGIWITVDYIFYSAPVNSSNKLKLLSRYKLPSRKDLENVKIPNESVGSDHLSLVGKFKLD